LTRYLQPRHVISNVLDFTEVYSDQYETCYLPLTLTTCYTVTSKRSSLYQQSE